MMMNFFSFAVLTQFSSSALDMAVPVGLLGLHRYTMSTSSVGGSALKPFSAVQGR